MDTQLAFSGFPRAGLEFLSDLATHNDRTWFEAHKKIYQEMLLEPAQAFVMALGFRLQEISKGIHYDTRTDGRGVLMRIHRDIRFSQDKTPYNTHLRGLFWEGERKKNESPAFGFQIDATGMSLMTAPLSLVAENGCKMIAFISPIFIHTRWPARMKMIAE